LRAALAKKLRTQTVGTEKLCKTLSEEKAGHKMLLKLTLGPNLIRLLGA